MTFRTRFAPSPTGPLHLGHAFSALTAFEMAQAAGGEFLLRIEDIDRARSRPEWEALIFEDLSWLGLSWPTPVLRQSDNMAAYEAAVNKLRGLGVIYACTCTRRDIQSALSAPQEGATPTHGPDGLIYPGTCRDRPASAESPDVALRINMGKAFDIIEKQYDKNLFSTNELSSKLPGIISVTREEACAEIGDFVVARRDMGTSYHLSVVVDDAIQKITHVVRGRDLFEATKIHIVLQHLLGLPVPVYHHHALIRDETGKRLAKRDDARALSTYRAEGRTPQDIRRMIGMG